MGDRWYELAVYRGDQFIETVYSREHDSQKRINDINNQVGLNKWTRYNVEN